MRTRKAPCGYCGAPRAVRLDGRFREHLGAAGGRCAGGGRVVAITVGEAEPGDVLEFAGGRRARVAAVLPSRPAGGSPGCYVTILHGARGVPPGAPFPVLTVCFADTLVRLAGTVMAVPVPAGEGVAALWPARERVPG
ncbi:MAG: hypothetical protein ACRDNT_11390 [Streptosporangiaceae bacterium]